MVPCIEAWMWQVYVYVPAAANVRTGGGTGGHERAVNAVLTPCPARGPHPLSPSPFGRGGTAERAVVIPGLAPGVSRSPDAGFFFQAVDGGGVLPPQGLQRNMSGDVRR